MSWAFQPECGGFQPSISIIRISRTPRGPDTPSTLPVWSPDKSLTMYSTAGAMPSGPRAAPGFPLWRGCVDDDAAAIFPHPAKHRHGATKGTLEMHLDDLVPVGLAGLCEGLVAQNAGIGDEDVGTAEMLDGVVEHGLAALHGGDVGTVRDRRAALGLDRVHDLLRHGGIGAGAVTGPAEIVDDDRCPFP